MGTGHFIPQLEMGLVVTLLQSPSWVGAQNPLTTRVASTSLELGCNLDRIQSAQVISCRIVLLPCSTLLSVRASSACVVPARLSGLRLFAFAVSLLVCGDFGRPNLIKVREPVGRMVRDHTKSRPKVGYCRVT